MLRNSFRIVIRLFFLSLLTPSLSKAQDSSQPFDSLKYWANQNIAADRDALSKYPSDTTGGIGISLVPDTYYNEARITSVAAGSPAEQGGILVDDLILAVNGESCMGLTLSQILKKIRGPVGNMVMIEVHRSSTGQDLTGNLDRVDISGKKSDAYTQALIDQGLSWNDTAASNDPKNINYYSKAIATFFSKVDDKNNILDPGKNFTVTTDHNYLYCFITNQPKMIVTDSIYVYVLRMNPDNVQYEPIANRAFHVIPGQTSTYFIYPFNKEGTYEFRIGTKDVANIATAGVTIKIE